MIPLILGAGLMAGGTAASMLGTSQRDKATRRAMKDYQGAYNANMAAEQAALGQQSGLLSGLARERQSGIGNYISELGMAQYPSDDGFASRQKGVLSDLSKMTGDMGGSSYAYSGSPRTNAEGMQAAQTGADNARMAEALLRQHEQQQTAAREQFAGHRLSLGDILRNNKGKSIQERFQLAQALRDLDWKKKSLALQGQMDDAQKKGAWLTTLGGLGTQAGGMLAAYGLSGAGGAGGVPTPGAAGMAGASPVAQSGFGQMGYDADLMDPMGASSGYSMTNTRGF